MAKRKRKRKKTTGSPSEGKAEPAAQAEVGVRDDVPALLPEPGIWDSVAASLKEPSSAAWALGFLALMVYVLSIQVPFVFDDAPVVTRNRMLWSWGGAWDLARFMPTRWLSNLTFLVNFQLAHGGSAPQMPFEVRDWWSYHVVSMGLHALNGILLFHVVRGLLLARPGVVGKGAVHWVALIGAAIWVVHPTNTMAVSYIAQRYALLSAAAILTTVFFYVRLRTRMEREDLSPGDALGGYLGVVGCVCVCLLTKENVAVVPVVLVLVEVFFFGGRQLKTTAVFFLPHVLGALVMIGTYGFSGFLARFFPAVSQSGSARVEYLLTEVPITLRYLHLWLLPYDMTAEQAFPILWDSGNGDWVSKYAGAAQLFWTAVVGHLLLVAFAVKLFLRGLRLVPFAIAWFYVLSIVESSIIPILDPMVDHRMYLPLAMLAPAAVAAVARGRHALLAWWPGARPVLPAAAALLLVALSIGTVNRVRIWTSATGLWEDTISKRPDCARAYSSLGMEHLYEEEWLAAVGPIETALQLGSYHVEGWNNLGKAYLELRQWRSAERALLRGIQVHKVAPSPSVRMCWNNVGLVYLQLAKEAKTPIAEKSWLSAASRHLRQAIKLDPMYEVAYLNLADADFQLMPMSETREEKLRYAKGVVEAVDMAKRVSEMRGGAITAVRYRQRLLAKSELGQNADAIVMIVELLKRVPELRGELVIDAGDVALRATRQKDPQAKKIVEKASIVMDIGIAAAKPAPSTKLLLLRGEVAVVNGDRDVAIRVLKQGLARGPSPVHQRLLDQLLKTAGPGQ
jgi:protein O-mannosyl-transferase